MSLLRPNRPLSRYAARLYCQVRYGRARAHAEEWWPGLHLLKSGDAGRIEWRGRTIAPLAGFSRRLPDAHELIVVGSGPSLVSQAVERIPLQSALLLNGAVHLLADKAQRPFGIVIEDERFVWRHVQTLCRLVPPETDCYLSTSVIRALCQTAPEWLARQTVRHIDFLHRPYDAARPDARTLHRLDFLRWSADGSAAISLSPEKGVMPAGSVAVTAAQIALALQPGRIGLAGIDLTDTKAPRFYESAGDTAMSRIDAARDRILSAFGLLDEEARLCGIEVENYSPVSLLGGLGIPYSARLER